MIGRARSLLDRLLARHRAIATDAPTDADLLARFARDRDPAAFELLVWRHGGTVLGVCRRALRDEHAAEDAFQAVFLVLARKAGAVRGNLGGWLFKVARRVSARAAARRHAVCEPLDAPAPPEPDAAESAELRALLDAEVARLPERLRAAVVLCYLGDHSTEAAARELGCPRGTVLSRLAAAREKLAARLARRGVALPAALTVPTLGAPAVSAVSAEAVSFCGGAAALSVPSQLALGVLTSMNRSTLLAALGAVGFVSVLGIGLGTGAAQPAAQPVANAPLAPPPPPPTAADRQKLDEAVARERARIDNQIMQLERSADSLKFEIEAIEKQIRLIGKANGADAGAVVRLTKRLENLDTETNQLGREVTKLQVEVLVLKKLLAEKSDKPADPQTVAEIVARDPSVIELQKVVRAARAAHEKAVQLAPNGGPAVKQAKDNYEHAVEEFKAREQEVQKAAGEQLRAQAQAAIRARLEQAETDLSVKREVLDSFKTERDSLLKLLAANAEGGHLIEEMRAPLVPQREMLAVLNKQILRLRLEQRGVTLPPDTAPAVSDDKLDRVLRELAELRKDVQELKRK